MNYGWGKYRLRLSKSDRYPTYGIIRLYIIISFLENRAVISALVLKIARLRRTERHPR